MVNTTPAYMAFQGGGALGMAHLGAWQKLSERFHPVGVAGTSAGAIVASFCAAGFDYAHVIQLFRQADWREFVKRQGLMSIIWRQNGLTDGSNFVEWISTNLAERFHCKPFEVTFRYLYERTDIYLAIVSCNLNEDEKRGDPLIFDQETESEVQVSFAVRASIAIPGVFTSITRPDRGQLLVDGGLVLNFPARILQQRANQSQSPLIGIRFKKPLNYLTTDSFIKSVPNLLETLMAQGNKPDESLLSNPSYIDVIIDTEGFESLNFNLTESEKETLLQRGRDAASRAIDKYNLKQAQLANNQTTAVTAKPTDISSNNQPPVAVTLTGKESVTPSRKVDSQPTNTLPTLSSGQLHNLAQILSACPAIKNESQRETVKRQLPEEIQSALINDNHRFTDILNLVTTCNEFDGGLISLIEIVDRFDGRKKVMQEVNNFIQQLKA